MWTGQYHPIPRLIVGVIALVIGLIIHQPIMVISGAIFLVFAGAYLVGQGNRGGLQG
jgi:hypothetical protein